MKFLSLAILSLLSLQAMAATTTVSQSPSTQLECSVAHGRYSLFVRLVDGSKTELEAVFWKWGTINLGPDQRDVPTMVDDSKPIPVTVSYNGEETLYSGEGFALQVRGTIELPNKNPPLSSDGQSMEYSAVLHSPTGLIHRMPAFGGVVLTDCVYN